MVQLVIFLAAFLCVSPAQPANADDSRLPPPAYAQVRVRGAWSRRAVYVQNDEVSFIRRIWRCRVSTCTKGKAPDSPEWEVIGPAVRG
jgi:hypothetical protein